MQKSIKTVEIISLDSLRTDRGGGTKGYQFPEYAIINVFLEGNKKRTILILYGCFGREVAFDKPWIWCCRRCGQIQVSIYKNLTNTHLSTGTLPCTNTSISTGYVSV